MKVIGKKILGSPLDETSSVYSYHAFLFPFEWEEKRGADRHAVFEEKTRISVFSRWLAGSSWKQQNIWRGRKSGALAVYNEKTYFYDFVHPALYDDGTEDSFLQHYEYDLPEGSRYRIACKGRGGEEQVYELDIEYILLHVYNTGVGVLSFHLANRRKEQSSPEDILRINQFGRRIYPPFFAVPGGLGGSSDLFAYVNWQEGLKGVQNSELAREIRITMPPQFISENFRRDLPPDIRPLSNVITGLFPDNLKEHISFSPVLDDRMFVLCWYGNKTLAHILKQTVSDKRGGSESYLYLSSDWWYRFVFVDGSSPSCQNRPMFRHLMHEHTNARWVEYGTLYGASRYSFVALTDGSEGSAFILSHLQTMYYKLVELCLVQRASILRFSDEITEISRLDPGDKKLSDKVNSLYRQYIRFVNKIYFREVTPQEQGIELYDLLQKHMRLDRDVKDLHQEIQEVNQYAMQVKEDRRNQSLEKLTYLATIFLIPTFITGYFGMNILDKSGLELLGWLGGGSVFAISMALWASTVKAKWLRWLLFAVTLLAVVVVLYFLSP